VIDRAPETATRRRASHARRAANDYSAEAAERLRPRARRLERASRIDLIRAFRPKTRSTHAFLKKPRIA